MESDVKEVGFASGVDELKKRLEVLLGAKSHSPTHEMERQRQLQEAGQLARRARLAEVGGQLLAAAFTFLGEMVPQRESTNGGAQMASDLDTNTASYIIKGNIPAVRRRLMRVPMARVFISAVTQGELRFGVARRPGATKLEHIVEEFLLRVTILPWDSDAARKYGSFAPTWNALASRWAIST